MMDKWRGLLLKILSPDSETSLKLSLARASIGSFGLQIGSKVLGMVSGILLARLLAADGYGTYAYAMSLIQIMTIPTVMGLPQLVVREVASFKVRKAYDLMRGLLIRANQFVFLVAVLMDAAALIVMFQIDGFNLQARNVFLISLLLLPLLGFNNLRMATLRGLGYVVIGQLPEMLFRPAIFILMMLAAVFLLPQDLSPQWAMFFQVAATGVAFFAGAVMLVRRLPKGVESAPAAYETRAWLKSALPFMFLAAMQIVNQRTDIIMLGMFRPMSEVGIYQAVSNGAVMVSFVLLAVNMAMAPTIAALYAQRDMERLQRIITYSARAILAGTLPLVLVLVFGGRWFLSVLFGEAFGAGANALRILCMGQLINAAMGSVGMILNMTGNEKYSVTGVAVAAMINVVLNIILIPKFGLSGAAFATSVSLVIWNLLLCWWVYNRLKIISTAFFISIY